MLADTNVKKSGSEKKVNKNTYDISSIKRVTRNQVIAACKKTVKKIIYDFSK